MSKHIEKYPGLYARCKALGINYQVPYLRCRKGWSVEAAVTTPIARPGRPGVKRPSPRPATPVVKLPTARYVWDRPEWNTKAHVVEQPKPRKVYTPRRHESTAPLGVKAVLKAYCTKFIKTGELDADMAKQLKDYADANRAVKDHSQRVPDEHEVIYRGREGTHPSDDGLRTTHQVDGSTAARIADFLRTS